MQCAHMNLVQPPCNAVYKYAPTASNMVCGVQNGTSSLISTYSVTRVVAARWVRRGWHFTRQYSRYRFKNSSACKCSLCCSLTGVCTSALHEQRILQLLLRGRVAAANVRVYVSGTRPGVKADMKGRANCLCTQELKTLRHVKSTVWQQAGLPIL